MNTENEPIQTNPEEGELMTGTPEFAEGALPEGIERAQKILGSYFEEVGLTPEQINEVTLRYYRSSTYTDAGLVYMPEIYSQFGETNTDRRHTTIKCSDGRRIYIDDGITYSPLFFHASMGEHAVNTMGMWPRRIVYAYDGADTILQIDRTGKQEFQVQEDQKLNLDELQRTHMGRLITERNYQ